MNFEEAMKLLKNGSEVRRASWDNKTLRLSKSKNGSKLMAFNGTPRDYYAMDGYDPTYSFNLEDYDAKDWEEYVDPYDTILEDVEDGTYKTGIVNLKIYDNTRSLYTLHENEKPLKFKFEDNGKTLKILYPGEL